MAVAVAVASRRVPRWCRLDNDIPPTCSSSLYTQQAKTELEVACLTATIDRQPVDTNQATRHRSNWRETAPGG